VNAVWQMAWGPLLMFAIAGLFWIGGTMGTYVPAHAAPRKPSRHVAHLPGGETPTGPPPPHGIGGVMKRRWVRALIDAAAVAGLCAIAAAATLLLFGMPRGG
jgi:hypothetical protein